MMRRAIILPGILIVVSIAAIIGVAALARTDAHQDLTEASLGSMQSRALAWSGVLAAQSQLFASRDSILSGAEPVLQNAWSTSISGGVGVVRLLPFSRVGEEPALYFEYESAKLDVNAISEESLSKLDAIGPELAERIIAARSGGFQCAEAIASVEGVTDEVLFGPTRDAESPVVRRGILESLTTFAFDPNISSAVGADPQASAGEPKIPISTPWTDAFAKFVAERCGEPVAQAMSKIAGGRVAIAKESDLLLALKAQGVPTAAWGSVLDCICVTDDLFRIGKTDINRANAAALALLPGLDEDSAGRLVTARSALAAAKRLDLTWPLTEGVIDEDHFLQLVDSISTRSAQFRIRVEAGVRRESGETVASEDSIERLDRAVILEAVIDIAGDEPRVAYLRDVTLLQTARRLAREVQLREAESPDTNAKSKIEIEAPVVTDPQSVPSNGAEPQEEMVEETPVKSDDASESDSVSSEREESSAPAKLKDRRLGRWKNSPRS